MAGQQQAVRVVVDRAQVRPQAAFTVCQTLRVKELGGLFEGAGVVDEPDVPVVVDEQVPLVAVGVGDEGVEETLAPDLIISVSPMLAPQVVSGTSPTLTIPRRVSDQSSWTSVWPAERSEWPWPSEWPGGRLA